MGEHKRNPNSMSKSAGGFSGQAQQVRSFRTQYGHNGTHVLVIFPDKVENLILTEEQVDDMAKALIEVKAGLIEHKTRAGVAVNS